MHWRLKLNEMSRVIRLFCDDLLIKCLTSQIEGFIAKLLNMENMLCNADRRQRAEMEKIVFESFKKDEQTIMKSLSYRKYCKIKDLTSMFDKTQPIIAYNIDPKDDYNHWKDDIREDVTTTISKLSTEHKDTVVKLNSCIANLNSNINDLKSESEIKKNRWKSKKHEYKQQIEELEAHEEKLSRRYRKTKNHKEELKYKVENLSEEVAKLEDINCKLNRNTDNLKQDLSNYQTECEELKNTVKQQTKTICDQEKEKEVMEENKTKAENECRNLKKNVNDLEENLAKKEAENEKLSIKIDEMEDEKYKDLEVLIQGVMDNEVSFKRLSRSLDKFLAESSMYDEGKRYNFINHIMNFLEIFSELSVFNELSEEKRMEVKDILIDFLFRFKDKHPFDNSEGEGPMDYFDKIMDFMRVKELKPSKSLRKEYSKSEFNKKMVLPSFELLNQKIEMKKDVYDKLEERYKAKGAFNYFFNPSIDILIDNTSTSTEGNKMLLVGFIDKKANKQIGASMWVFNDGGLYQGYCKNNLREYYGREFYPNGNFYEGGHKNSNWHGKGERQLVDGERYVGTYVDHKAQGPFEFYAKDGKKYNYVYKDNIRVDQ